MADRIEMGAQHIAPGGAQAEQAYEPIRRNLFKVIIHDLPGGSSPRDVIPLSLVSFPVPQLQVERTSIDYGNEQRHVAGGASIEQVNLVVVDYVKPNVAEQLFDWWKQVYDPDTGAIGLAADYKKNAEVWLYNPKGEKVRTWTLEGVFPTNFNQGEFSMSARGEVQQIQMQLSVDLVKFGEAGAS
jgi:hypothetical protein